MRVREDVKVIDTVISCDINTLADMTGLGKSMALKLGKDAKARFKYGRRTLYNVEKVKNYIDQLTEQE